MAFACARIILKFVAEKLWLTLDKCHETSRKKVIIIRKILTDRDFC